MTRKPRIASHSAPHRPATTRRRMPSPPLRVTSVRRPACPFKALFSPHRRAFFVIVAALHNKPSRSRGGRKVAESRLSEEASECRWMSIGRSTTVSSDPCRRALLGQSVPIRPASFPQAGPHRYSDPLFDVSTDEVSKFLRRAATRIGALPLQGRLHI